MLFLMFVSFFTSRIVLQNLGVTDFGIYNIVGGFASMFVFFQSSLSNATQRDLGVELRKGNTSGVASVFRQHQMLYFLIMIGVLIFAETAGLWFVCNKLVIPPERVNAAMWVYQFTIISCCLVILSIVYDAAIIVHEDMKIYSYVGIFEGMAKLAVAYMISIVSSDKLVIYAFLLLLLSFVTRVFYVLSCQKYDECRYAFAWNIKGMKGTLSFISWNTTGTFMHTLNDQGVNILLNLFFGPAVNAARGISYQVSMAVNNFSTNLNIAVRPQIIKSYAAGDWPYLLKLFFNSSKYSVFIMWLICLPLMLCIEPLLNVWLTFVPEYTSAFTIWVLAYMIVNVLNYPIWTIALAAGCLKSYILTGCCISLMAFPVSFACLKLGGPPVSVFQILLAVRVIYLCRVLMVIRRYVDFPIKRYFSQVLKPVVIVIICSGFVSLPASLLSGQELGGCVFTGCICFLSVLLSIWVFGMAEDERNVIIMKIKRFNLSVQRTENRMQ